MTTPGRSSITVAGIDVGGARKGFHAVALAGHAVKAKINSTSPRDVAEWCRAHDARVVAVDAPCGWRRRGRPRAAESALMREGIHCFFTPTAREARSHPTNYFGWMLAGFELYDALRPVYQLLRSAELPANRAVCFEAFPQAIACRLSGCVVSAREKKTVRRALLEQAGLETAGLRNIDEIDAAVCALMAQLALDGRAEMLGDPADGLIVVPRRR